jgi:DNA modification methylase
VHDGSDYKSEAAGYLVELRPLESLIPYARNARTHSDAQVAQIAASITEFGFTNPVLADAKGIVAGHGRVLGAQRVYSAGGVIKRPNGELLPAGTVPVLDCTGWSDAQRRAYILADNQLALNAGWDIELLKVEVSDLQADAFPLELVGFDDAELKKLLAPPKNDGLADPDEVPDLQADAVTRAGDVWVLGRHRLLCGDATNSEHVARLLAGAQLDLVLTDPPYCSGGFQEAGKRSGSVGTRGEAMIANDTLSTRGYQALVKTVFERFAAGSIYVFTDWRMWVPLFDVAESSGYGVRNMIVWDKGTPGMGRGWRMQHELVLAATRVKQPFDPKQAQGNVIQSKRTGNKLHPTEKPVDLIETIIGVSDFAASIADPFTGSGTTLIACERAGRTFYGTELEPGYVDVAVTRWEKFTGQAARLEANGRSFAEVLAERRPAGAIQAKVIEQ